MGEKIKKFIKFIVFVAVLFYTAYGATISADTKIPSQNVSTKIYSKYTSVYDGNMYVFNSYQDKKTFDTFYGQKSLGNYNPIKVRQKFVRSVKLGRRWVNYNPYTPSWQKAGSYSIAVNANITVTGSFSYKGATFGIGASLSKGVTINMPANKAKESRLGLEADVTMNEYVIEMYDTSQNNRVINRFPAMFPIITDTYNVVKYK